MKNISFPDNWKSPKYSLGQSIQQGKIVGIHYHLPDTKRSDGFGEGWVYWILLNKTEYDLEGLVESDIKPLVTEERKQQK